MLYQLRTQQLLRPKNLPDMGGRSAVADKLVLKNMVFYGYHGAFGAERELGQRLAVDLELYTDLSGANDDAELAVNYVDAYALVKEIVEEREFSLVETIAERIASHVLDMFSLQQVVVRVRNLEVPVGGFLDYLEVEITRGG